MKRKFLYAIPVIAFLAFTAMINSSSGFAEIIQIPSNGELPGNPFPDSITGIFDRSCYDCHSDRSGNFAAKGKLNFSNWEEYTTSKKVSKMDAICDAINKGRMPKKNYVSKNPGKALTQSEKEMVCKWAEEESKKLFGE